MFSICRTILAAALVLVGATSSFAAGFAMYEYSARGNALGGALTARADDPSANAYNPAGITQIPGAAFLAGATAINPEASVEMNGETTKARSKFWFPPHLYATQQLNDTFWLGFGLYSRFGLGIEYDEDWDGRYNTYEAGIQSVSLNPNLAVKVTDWLSVAAGPEIMWFHLTKKQAIDATPGGPFNDPTTSTFDVHADLEGSGWGYGAVAGIHATPLDWLKLGFTYRSPVKQKVEGEAKFKKPAALAGVPVFNDTDVSGSITLPDSYTFGVAIYPIDKLSVEFNAVYTRWSSYDKLRIEFDDRLNPADPNSDVSETKKDWKDVWRYQLGVEYAATDRLDLRASYVYDMTPDPDEHADYMVPANDRHLFGVGAGFHITESLNLDLAYTYLHILERDIDARLAEGIPADSKFKDGCAHMYAVSLGYRF